MYKDRRDAGRTLAQALAALPGLHQAIVLALPRGGVPVACEIAHAFHLPLDILAVRKLGAPGQPELALGAIASGGAVTFNSDILRHLRLSAATLQSIQDHARRELEDLEARLREGRPPLSIEGRTVILVDDGLATGASMRAAARAVRPRAHSLILAAPVGAPSTCVELLREADHVVCPLIPDPLDAVGQYYLDFSQTTDDEVRRLLATARRDLLSPAPAAPPTSLSRH